MGGWAETLEKVRGILEAIGDKVIHVGDIGCGNIAKLINNMISFGCSQITFEGMVLGAKSGIDVEILREVVSNSSGANNCVQNRVPDIFAGKFEPGFRVDLALKDIGLALGMAKEYAVPTPIGVAVEQQLLITKASGWGDKDSQAAIRPLEKLAGVEVRTHK